jgi:flavodoxin
MDNPGGRIPNFTGSRFLLHIVFASTSGHTEYVVAALIDSLKDIAPGWEIEETMAETTQPQDLLRGDVLLLASATWNTWSIEGQLNPYMSVLLQDKARNLDLASKPCAAIGLGDDRYFYTARAVHAAGVMAPRFEVDPTWPKPLPNHWLMGETIGVSATATIISGSSSARVRSNQGSSARRRVLPMRSAALRAYEYGIGPESCQNEYFKVVEPCRRDCPP